MSNEQLTVPGVPHAYAVIEVTAVSSVHRLRVDLEEWQSMDEEERNAWVYEAAEELGWLNVSFVRESPKP